MIEGRKIYEAWASYVKTAYPGGDLPADQIRELRRAFYAGGYALFTMCLSLSDDDVSAEESQRLVANWEAEFDLFIAMVEMGRR
jgi:hypothetical protein